MNSSKISEGTLRPPGNLLLRLILRHFRYEIRWCFAVSAVSNKVCGCWFLPFHSKQQQQSKLEEVKMRQNWISIVGFQKKRFSLRRTCYCDCFCVIFGTKLDGVLLFRLCFEKGVWLLVSCFIRGSSSNQNGVLLFRLCFEKWRSKLDKIGFLVGFQKGRFGLRETYYCD